MLRRAAWADLFYPAHPDLLNQELERCLGAAPAEKIARPLGCVAPHAGYVYSGPIAGAVYSRLELPERFIVLCPNHTGLGAPLAFMPEGSWETPLGNIPIDRDLALSLSRRCRLLAADARAHEEEHSLEVQLPFLQKLRPGLQFVPISIGTEAYEALEMLGHALADTVRDGSPRALIVASSDMN